MQFARASLAAFCLLLAVQTGFANSHWFPRLRPLFPGLDEANLSLDARKSLQMAKIDFLMAKRMQDPRHARFVGVIPFTNSRVFQGDGYQVVIVQRYHGSGHVDGPAITLESRLTGGKPYAYDEVDEVVD